MTPGVGQRVSPGSTVNAAIWPVAHRWVEARQILYPAGPLQQQLSKAVFMLIGKTWDFVPSPPDE